MATPAKVTPTPYGFEGHSVTGRREDYAWLRLEQNQSQDAAVARLGISTRTAERYEQFLTNTGIWPGRGAGSRR